MGQHSCTSMVLAAKSGLLLSPLFMAEASMETALRLSTDCSQKIWAYLQTKGPIAPYFRWETHFSYRSHKHRMVTENVLWIPVLQPAVSDSSFQTTWPFWIAWQVTVNVNKKVEERKVGAHNTVNHPWFGFGIKTGPTVAFQDLNQKYFQVLFEIFRWARYARDWTGILIHAKHVLCTIVLSPYRRPSSISCGWAGGINRVQQQEGRTSAKVMKAFEIPSW